MSIDFIKIISGPWFSTEVDFLGQLCCQVSTHYFHRINGFILKYVFLVNTPPPLCASSLSSLLLPLHAVFLFLSSCSSSFGPSQLHFSTLHLLLHLCFWFLLFSISSFYPCLYFLVILIFYFTSFSPFHSSQTLTSLLSSQKHFFLNTHLPHSHLKAKLCSLWFPPSDDLFTHTHTHTHFHIICNRHHTHTHTQSWAEDSRGIIFHHTEIHTHSHTLRELTARITYLE